MVSQEYCESYGSNPIHVFQGTRHVKQAFQRKHIQILRDPFFCYNIHLLINTQVVYTIELIYTQYMAILSKSLCMNRNQLILFSRRCESEYSQV